MTVEQLIKQLEKVKNKELEIVIQGIDHTDYIYYNEIESMGVEKVHLSEDDHKETKVYVIDGGIF